MPRISVIVPIYKAENYLRKCVNSILTQTFADFELILVNDGSPDNSPTICSEYTQMDPRVRVIHQENGGVSVARNTGIAQAKGEYLVFVDSDDYVMPAYLEELYRGLVLGADIAICGYCTISNDRSNRTCLDRTLPLRHVGNIKEVFKNIIQNDMLYSPCNKMFRTKVLRDNHILFDKTMTLGEDLCFNTAYLYFCEKCYLCNLPLYFYIKTNSVLSKKITLDYFNIQKHLYETVRKFVVDKGISYDLSDRVELLLRDALGALAVCKLTNKHEVCLKMKEILTNKLTVNYLTAGADVQRTPNLFYLLLNTKSTFLIMNYFRVKTRIGKILRNKDFNVGKKL